jgi:hypothetical protein
MDTNGLVYEGTWENDMQHGQGVETWDYAVNKYIGNFFKGKKNQKGRIDWENGNYYEGDFVDNHF